MTTKAYVIATALVALMTVAIFALVPSPVLAVKMDVTARGEDGGQRGGNGGSTSADSTGNDDSGIRNDDGYSSRHGGTGGPGGDADGGDGGNTANGADKTVISIHKTY
jgi:hypothetical protein